ncbi:cysteine--tRNA ligase [Planctomycetales bacterium]|nr:cysteine--tRNA ligase [Planctomycetales bacterium]GHT06496.1 cysteine--tRNA ligase [Planctomycetales bacterium]
MLELYSTDRRAKTPFVSLEPRRVKMYVCGPTVYDHCHIGHARPAVVFDVIRRYLEYAGYAVTFLSNITDIDDKIINRAADLGISCAALTAKYQAEYEADMAALNVRAPSIRPKATEHIGEMLDLIKTLEQKGAAYLTSRGVWFDVTKFPAYGKLSGKTADTDDTEHRVEIDPEKRHPQDFALWKFAKAGEPQWESPWGAGRPGWHIECSAMSGKYCNMQLDIHGGGADLIFPHHENEIAQSETASGKPFAQYWLHNGFITIGNDETKMGKSKGNAFGLREAFNLCGAAAVRFWILGTHYRMPLLYKPELLTSAQNSLDRLYTCWESLPIDGKPSPEWTAWDKAAIDEKLTLSAAGFVGATIAAGNKFIAAMNDDGNTPQALAALFAFIKTVNVEREKMTPTDGATAREMLRQMLGVLGLPEQRETGGKEAVYLQILVDLRNEARAQKNFALSDAIRDKLAAAGVELKDKAAR